MRHVAVVVIFSGLFGLVRIEGARCEPAPAATEVRPENDATKKTHALKRVEVGATKPAHRCGEFYLAGQPPREDLAKWKARGVRMVINLRMPGEIDWDERAAVESLGMKYVAVPFGGPDTLSEKKIRQALNALRTGHLSDQSTNDAPKTKAPIATPILLHCASSNRVGAIWYAHRILHDGMKPEAALKEAKTVGLKSMGYLVPVEAYIENETNRIIEAH